MDPFKALTAAAVLASFIVFAIVKINKRCYSKCHFFKITFFLILLPLTVSSQITNGPCDVFCVGEKFDAGVCVDGVVLCDKSFGKVLLGSEKLCNKLLCCCITTTTTTTTTTITTTTSATTTTTLTQIKYTYNITVANTFNITSTALTTSLSKNTWSFLYFTSKPLALPVEKVWGATLSHKTDLVASKTADKTNLTEREKYRIMIDTIKQNNPDLAALRIPWFKAYLYTPKKASEKLIGTVIYCNLDTNYYLEHTSLTHYSFTCK